VDLYAADRKFSEYYNVLEQILGILLRLIKEFKLQHQHEYDGMRKEWLCKRCQTMSTKLRVLEHLLLRDTYTQESLPALQKIRSVIIAFRLFRSPLCVLLAHRNFKSSVHSLHEFHFVPIFSSPCSSPNAMRLNASCYSSGRTLQLSSLKL
jgi:hypothetical protein